MFKIKATHLLAFFALAYVGAEVTLGGQSDQYPPFESELERCFQGGL